MYGYTPSPLRGTPPSLRAKGEVLLPHAPAWGSTAKPGGGVSHRQILNLLSFQTFIIALALLAIALWIPIKAEVAQILLHRAFTQSIITGEKVKPWSWADTWPVAEIRVPRLGASAVVLHGSTGEALAFGPTYLPDTPKPGERGTSVIAAHRDTHFAFLKDVVIGDEVIVQRTDGLTFRFRIVNSWVAKWNASGIDRHAKGHNLVMSTCWPFDAMVRSEERFIVEAQLVK
jgi:sortase A